VADEVPAPVPHRQYVFTLPKMLRVYFRRDRCLLGKLSSCAADALKTLFPAACKDLMAVPGIIIAVQTYCSSTAGTNGLAVGARSTQRNSRNSEQWRGKLEKAAPENFDPAAPVTCSVLVTLCDLCSLGGGIFGFTCPRGLRC